MKQNSKLVFSALPVAQVNAGFRGGSKSTVGK